MMLLLLVVRGVVVLVMDHTVQATDQMEQVRVMDHTVPVMVMAMGHTAPVMRLMVLLPPKNTYITPPFF
jgi:hypothetical protein